MCMFATSDLHADFADDTLVAAGDVAPRLQAVEIVLKGQLRALGSELYIFVNSHIR